MGLISRVSSRTYRMSVSLNQQAPDFETSAVVNGAIEEAFRLSSFKGRYIVLFFYPLDFTFVCPTEIVAFNDRAPEFKALDCELFACSVNSAFSHLAWTQRSRKE